MDVEGFFAATAPLASKNAEQLLQLLPKCSLHSGNSFRKSKYPAVCVIARPHLIRKISLIVLEPLEATR
jgi:hypothetical protein